jgi:RNA polymerase sigma factor for flagellar operon FliA
MPHSVEIADLVQEGVLGLMDAAGRFDAARGIKFETFAERRVRGAMIDALRRGAWPRAVRRQRRELDAAREALVNELGHQPSTADLAARVGVDEVQLMRTIVRINTIEATSPLETGRRVDDASLPTGLRPSQPDSPDQVYEKDQIRERVRHAIAALPAREQRVIQMYYDEDVTMKEIGAAIGVNESRVSQLHARAIGRLRAALDGMWSPFAGRARTLVAFAAKTATEGPATAKLASGRSLRPVDRQRTASAGSARKPASVRHALAAR